LLALLSRAAMFENRVNGFVPNMGQPFAAGVFPPALRNENSNPMAIQLEAIYQAAVHRAKEEYEIDKLFNAEFYNGDYEI
jgi:hypothetical protein